MIQLISKIISLVLVAGVSASAADSKKGDCLGDLCIGETVYAVWENDVNRGFASEKATIAGIDNGSYLLHFETGKLAGQYGANWNRNQLATLSGCSQASLRICVNEKIFFNANNDKIFEGVVVGIQGGAKDRLVIHFADGDKFGNYSLTSEIYKREGQSGKFAVGDLAVNKVKSSAKVQIVGFNAEQKYMLKYMDGELANRMGGRWSDSDLILLGSTDSKFRKPVLTVEQINEELKLPVGAQIIIKQKLYIPRNKGCGAPADSSQDVQCFICQSSKVTNSTLYDTEGILAVTEAKLQSNKKELQMQIVDSEDLNLVRCVSKSNQEVNISSFEELQKTLNESGIYFKDPGPVVKSFGKTGNE